MANLKRLASISAVLALALCPKSEAVTFSGLVAFGDSLSDLGNTVNTVPDSLSGYNSYYYDDGRWSNGPLWVEHLNDNLGLTTLQRNAGSSLTGTDFAYGGSTSGTGNTDFFLPNLQSQISSYTTLLDGNPTGMPDVSTTLFTVWSGGNDIIYLVDDGTAITPAQIAANISTALTSLYDAGGRYFLVPNLPPLGDKPNYVNDPTKHTEANDFVNEYNPLLEQTLADLRTSLAGATIISLDVYSLVSNVLDDPGAYGFTNVTDSAFVSDSSDPHGGSVVDDPNQYLFWDQTHPTLVGHEDIGDYAYETVMSAVPEPATLPLLLIGAGVGWVVVRRRAAEAWR